MPFVVYKCIDPLNNYIINLNLKSKKQIKIREDEELFGEIATHRKEVERKNNKVWEKKGVYMCG